MALVPALRRIASFPLLEPKPTTVILFTVGALQKIGFELFPMSVLKPSPSIPLS